MMRWLCTKKGQIPKQTLPEWIQQMHQSKKMIDLNELRFFGKYGINYDIDQLIAENSMFDRSNFTKVLQTEEKEEVDVVEGNDKERLVLSQIVVYSKNVATCVPCLTIFQ